MKLYAILCWITSLIGLYVYQHELRHEATAQLWIVILSISAILGGLAAGTFLYPGGKNEYWVKKNV